MKSTLLLRTLVSLCILLNMSLSMSAQNGWSSINVAITPNHKDWNYRTGETAGFKVEVQRSGTTIDNVKIDYEAGPEMYPTVKKNGVVLKDGTMNWSGTMK